MKKRIDYKSKKFVITAALILIVSIVAVAGVVTYIRSNNDTQAIVGEQNNNVDNNAENQDNKDNAVDNSNDSTSNVVQSDDDSSVSVENRVSSDRNDFSTLGTTITEYKDVEKVTSKNKMIGWNPDVLNININNSVKVNKTRIEVLKEFTSYIDMSEEVKEDVNEEDKEITEDILPTSVEDIVYGVEKEATEDTKVDLHDVLTYTVTVKNTGNQPVYNVEVVDTIVFDENGELVVKTIEEILPGESKSVTFEYVVVEEDILNGKIVNSAIATIEGKIPTELDEPVVVPTEDINRDYTVAKELISVNDITEIPEKVFLNDVLVYEITVTNIGNVTLENVLVEDSLEGAELLEGEENPIEKLTPGMEKTVSFKYVVTEADVAEGKVINSATVTAGDDEKNPEEDVVTPVNQEYKYTVKYLEKETLKVLNEEKEVVSKYDAEIKSADEIIEIDGYYYDSANVKTLVVGVDESKNVIEIYYTKRADLSYTVNYLEKDTNLVIKDAKKVENQVFMSVINSSSEVIDISGYNFDSLNPESITIVTDETKNVINLYYTKRTDLSYEVNYLEKGTNAVLAPQKVVGGQIYKSIVTENAIEISGYDKVAPTSANLTIEVTGNVINFYYTKRTDLSYEVNYLEKGTNAVLAPQKVVSGQTYKATVTENAIEISGYDKVEPITETITIEVTGNVINFYYTKRTDLKYTVNYLEKDTEKVLASQKVVTGQTYKSTVTENAIEISGYDKVAPTSASITIEVTGNIINFYYTKRTDLSYEVNYLEKDTEKVLASQKVVTGQTYKSTVTENAIDIVGYDKVAPTTKSITIEVTGNVINFYYTKRTDLSYEVNYLEKDTEKVLAPQKVVGGQTYKSTVTENAIDIEGYDKVAPTTKSITIEVTGNVINFYYTKRTDLSYEVNYLEKDTEKVLAPQKVVDGQTYKSEVTENAIDIVGYDKVNPTTKSITIEVTGNVINFYYTKRTDLTYIVNYLEKDTNIVLADAKIVDNQVFGSEVTENAIDIVGYDKVAPTSVSITIEVTENVINFYYTKRTDLSYEVNYLEKGTNEVLAPQKVVTGQTYKSTVTESAIDIVGYDKVEPITETITIEVTGNVINFYYTKRTDLSYEVNYLEIRTEKVLAPQKVVSGQTYKSEVTENAIDIDGYDKVAPTERTIVIEVTGNIINFYYMKRDDLTYVVNYLEKGTNINLAESKVVSDQVFGTEITENAIDIVGYNKVNPVTETITIGTGSNVINFYYTKRTDLSYEVNYLEKDTGAVLAPQKVVNNQTYKSEVTENAIDIEGYNKVEPVTETITIEVTGNVINFYYTKRTDLSYEVNYLEKDTGAVLAPQKVVSGQTYKTEITENAIDIDGYNKVEPVTETITIEVTGNVINFYYTKRTDLIYIVNYLEKDTNIVLADAKIVDNQVFGSEVTENAIEIEGYDKVEPTTATITIAVDIEENVINFYYTKRNNLSYEVNYLEKDTNAVLAPQKVVTGQTYESEITENAIEIEGYDKVEPITETITIEVTGNVINFYYTKRTDLSYEVNYLEKDTNAVLAPQKVVDGQTYKSEVTENAIEIAGYNKVAPTSASITIEVTGNVINFYYTKRTDLSYEVNYLEKDTNAVLAPQKVVDGQTYKAEVTENAIDIEGYDKVEPVTETITIEVTGNVINFYYTKRTDLSYEVNYLEKGTNEVLAPQKVVGGQTYKAEVTENAIEIAGYNKVAPTSASITIEVTGNVINFYYTKRTDLSYEVNYLEKDTNESLAPQKVVDGQTYKAEVTENAIDIEGYDKVEPVTETITIEVTGNVINFYYTKRTDLSYEVNYLEKGTNAVLAPQKVVGGQTYKSIVTENAIDIANYNKENPTSVTITIEVTGNVINFYYTKATSSYTVNYLEYSTNNVLRTAKVVEDVNVGTVITSSNEVIDITGYGFHSTDKDTLTVTTVASNNVINIYYEAINVTLTKLAVDEKGAETTPLYKYEEGDIVRFKLSVKNNGSTTVKNYIVTDVLPSELSFYGTQPAGTTVSENTLTWTISNLAAGATTNITVVTKVNNDSWSSSPQDTYHSRDGVMLANGTETVIRESQYKGNTKTAYDTNENYINCSFYIYNSQKGEVPFENGNTQYSGGYTAVGFGRVSGIAYNSSLTSIEDLNSVIDTHNLVQDVIVYAPNYNPGEGKIVLWYVSKTIRGTEETYGGKTAYVKYHVDGIVVDLNNVYAVTNRITGSNGSASDDMVLVIDDSSTSTGITSNDTVRPTTSEAMTTAINPFANLATNQEAIVSNSNTVTNTVVENIVVENIVVENTIVENTVVENTIEDEVIENTIIENIVEEQENEEEVVEEEIVEEVIEETKTEESEITEVIETEEETEMVEPITEEVILPNTEIKETEGEATV